MINLIDLTNKRIIVTGASQGIGRDTAILLSKLGAELVLIARNEEKLKNALNNLEGNKNSYYCFDINNIDEIDGFIKTIVKERGKLDGLVYAAGISNNRPISLFDVNSVQKIMNLNFNGFIEFIRCISKKGRFNSGMKIVGISSVAAFSGNKAQTIYAASKAGMNGAVRCLAKELSDKNININTVAPGMIDTDMYKKYIENYGEDSDANKRLLSRQFLGIGKTVDVAAAIAFLISPAASFITGICLPVDGGFTSN